MLSPILEYTSIGNITKKQKKEEVTKAENKVEGPTNNSGLV